MAEPSLEDETRRAFHKIHLEHLADPYVANRHSDIVDPVGMGLPADFLVGAKCADLGCGSAGHGVVNLLELGARSVNALDLDESFVGPLTDRMQQIGKNSDCWHADIGSILELPYESDTFDFALCRGVIHHVADELTALKEIYRILKVGGKAFIFVTGKGGILNRFFKETLRDEYRSNPEMRALVESGEIEQWLKTQILTMKDIVQLRSAQRVKRLALTSTNSLRATPRPNSTTPNSAAALSRHSIFLPRTTWPIEHKQLFH